MRAALASRAARLRSNSLSTVPPPQTSSDYSNDYAGIAASILYRSPLPSQSGLPLFVLNAAAFPDADEVDYDSLLPYVLARLPGEEDLLAGADYEVIFFAGGQPDNATSEKKAGPGIGWYLQAYHVLSRATRKRLQRLLVVHERSWVRVLIEVFGTIVSPKFKKKIIHINTLSGLAMHVPLENVLIPPSAYLHDRRLAQDIYAPYVSGRRVFAADHPLPRDYHGRRRLPRVLRETTSFLCEKDNLKSEGLFRIPPSTMLLGILRESYDRGQRFIVWKEDRVSYVEPGMDKTTLAEVHPADAYGVHLAAGLIKVWYRELKAPIFPETSYEAFRREYGAIDREISLEQLTDTLSPSTKSSILSETARLIMTWHLLPLLSKVASFERFNKMNAENLAICFAPAMVCGSDQLQDAKMISIVRRFLQRAIEDWLFGLGDHCGATFDDFTVALQPPAHSYDYEDPLNETTKPQVDQEAEPHRIVLNDDEDKLAMPTLPPRSSSLARNRSPNRQPPALPTRRKPAPALTQLPRYSTLEGVPAKPQYESPTSYESPADGFGPQRDSGIPAAWDEKSKQVDVRNVPFEAGPRTLPASKPEKSSSGLSNSDEPIVSGVDSLRESSRSRSGSDAVKRKPVSSGGPTLAQIQSQTSQLRSVSGSSTTSNDDAVFAKPTWAASSRQVSASSATSDRRPSPPLTIAKSSQISQGKAPAAPIVPMGIPKPRSPSPALLQRIASMEKEKLEANGGQKPQKLGQKQESVDNLRRLYEDRAGAVATLGVAAAIRRGSSEGRV